MCLEFLQDAIGIYHKHYLPACQKYEVIVYFFLKPELQLTCISKAHSASIFNSSSFKNSVIKFMSEIVTFLSIYVIIIYLSNLINSEYDLYPS